MSTARKASDRERQLQLRSGLQPQDEPFAPRIADPRKLDLALARLGIFTTACRRPAAASSVFHRRLYP